MNSRIFVDETKQRGYVVVAVAISVLDIATARACIRELVLPGQRRVHMKDERDARRRKILSAMISLDLEVMVFDAGKRYRTDVERRHLCLTALVKEAVGRGASDLVLEQDDSLVVRDRRSLYAATHEFGGTDLRYEHRRAGSESLLALPDAFAWSWARGGQWRRRIESAVVAVHEL